jgi:CubicO group peptidase (beta-lactamase class C family)
MVTLHVPGVGIAVIHNGAIEWVKGYGVQRIGGKLVTPDTLFQAGSISKPIAALAALHLVQQGKLQLDADVNSVLTTWKVPTSSAAPGATVTLRELLTHTAGFTVHGFPGYAANAPVPTLVQVLNGEKPANTEPIRLENAPGNTWKYSGGGYTVIQQLLMDA